MLEQLGDEVLGSRGHGWGELQVHLQKERKKGPRSFIPDHPVHLDNDLGPSPCRPLASV